jgi:prepilin-type processing-associated H-X9-DG protein
MEGDIRYPAQTPVFADGTFPSLHVQASDLPAENLQTSQRGAAYADSMWSLTIPRHGSRPKRVPTLQRLEDLLPGAINVAFYDGHVAQVRLEGLWRLNWSRDYQPPTKRPGLK